MVICALHSRSVLAFLFATQPDLGIMTPKNLDRFFSGCGREHGVARSTQHGPYKSHNAGLIINDENCMRHKAFNIALDCWILP
jgi:hypothetical protein